MFPPELEQQTFRADNEFGWTRVQIPMVVDILGSHGLAILGGELWWVHQGISGTIPQRHGPPAVYCWETNRRHGESWAQFIQRGSSHAIASVERWPEIDDLPPDLPGLILYNLTWTSEVEFDHLSLDAVRSRR